MTEKEDDTWESFTPIIIEDVKKSSKKQEKEEEKEIIEEEEEEKEIIEEEIKKKKKEPKNEGNRVNIKRELEDVRNILITSISNKQKETTFVFTEQMNTQKSELKKLIQEEVEILRNELKQFLIKDKNLEKEIILSFIVNFHKGNKEHWIRRDNRELALDLRVDQNPEFNMLIERMEKEGLLTTKNNKQRRMITQKAVQKYETEIKSLRNLEIAYYSKELEEKNL
jgi:hypothetical protein